MRRVETERARVMLLAGRSHELERNIEHALSATYALAAMIRRENGSANGFEELATQMLPLYSGVGALQLAPGGIIQKSIPLAGNEKAIGHDLLKDPLRTKEAFLARDTGKLTLAGPFDLVQGGQAAVGRLPLFMDDEHGKPAFWGFVSVLIKFPEILESVKLPQLVSQGIGYELYRTHPDTGKKEIITASSSTPLVAPVQTLLRVPNGTWMLDAAPLKGWGDPLGLGLKIALGLAFSFMLAILVKLLLQSRTSQKDLEFLIGARTSEILSAKSQLQATLDAIPDLLFELGTDGICHDCRMPQTGLWKPSAEDLIGRTVAETLPETAAGVVMSALMDALQNGQSHGMQFELQLSDGTRWFELSVSRKDVADESHPRFIVLAREITERKKIEEELKASEQRFRDIVNTTDGIVWEADAETFVFTFISEKAERLLGYPISDWLKPGFWIEHLHPDDRDWAPSFCAACTGRLEQHDFEYRSIASDGRTVWLRDIVTVLPENGQPRWLRGIMVDITTSKLAEIALQENAARYLAVTQSANDAIVTADSAGNIVGWNRQAEAIFGYTENEALDQPLTLLMPERYRERHQAGMNNLQTGEASSRSTRVIELEGLRKDDSEFPIELSLARWTVGEAKFVSGTIRDVTERHKNEANLRIAATAFESQEGMLVTDDKTVILRVNRAFTEITGYSPEEAVGQTPHLLNSGRHDAEFYATMWQDLAQKGAWQGEIWNRRKNGEVYLEWLAITAVKSDADRITHYVGTLTDLTRRKQAEETIQRLAFYDPLTQLPNRRLLMDRLQQALTACSRSGSIGALLFIDLDDFKTLNDTLGHDTGDMLLRQVAERLVACIREGDTVSRFGGDEFVLVLEDLSDDPHEAAIRAETVGEKVLGSLSTTYRLAGSNHRSTPSIGIALFDNHSESAEDLLKRADLAMYQAKAAGRNTLRFFDNEMQAAVSSRANLEADLRQGLRFNEFVLHFQAQVNGEGHLTGVEALVRWQQPKRGLISPAEFIPLAETTGLILPLGQWVLEAACQQLVAWSGHEDMASVSMSVNISARQFRDKDFVSQVIELLERTGANPNRLKLELTESLLVEDVENTIEKMVLLKNKGISFSLDDFGTGYSSLSYLKRLPLDQLKIDQSFVRDILTDQNDAAIARTVVALGNSLGIAVIAEGVETAEQRNFLADNGCLSFQGYLFGRPGPAEESENFRSRQMA